MKEMRENDIVVVSGGAWTSEHGISGGLSGASQVLEWLLGT